jgi:hypothetical protein
MHPEPYTQAELDRATQIRAESEAHARRATRRFWLLCGLVVIVLVTLALLGVGRPPANEYCTGVDWMYGCVDMRP